MNKNKMLVIGIDGGTFDIILPLIQKGRLPYLASITNQGFNSYLTSIIPPITAPAWVSFMTGVNPGKHGIFDWISDIHRNSKEGCLLNSNHIRAKTLWQILSEHDQRSIVVGVPFTYPAFPINGVMVGISQSGAISAHPPDILRTIIKETGYDQKLSEPPNTFREVPREEVLDAIIRRAQYLTDKVKEISLHLLRAYPWDFLMTHFMATDILQHYFWHFIDPDHPAYDHNLVSKYGSVIYQGYQKVDAAIGEILNEVKEECNVMVISDHGFAPIYKFFYVNKWLEENGWLKVRTSGLYSTKFTYPNLYKVFNKAGFESIGNILPSWLRNLRIPGIKRIPKSVSEWIDWSQTKAYASPFGININLRGREPHGIVNPGQEYNGLRGLIKEKLYILKDKNNGESLINRIYFREDIYHGPYVNDAADIFFMFSNPFYLQASDLSQLTTFKELTKDKFATANHRYSPKGILTAKGPNIKMGANLNNPKIMDIAPTILYLMGLPVLESMDGKVLTDAIQPEFLTSQPLRFTKEEMTIQRENFGTVPVEEEQIKEHLRRLGYLG